MSVDLQKLSVSALPLIFTYTGKVAGEGFIANVTIRGRLIARIVDDGVMLAGVAPGGLATYNACQTIGEADADFRRMMTTILFDISGSVADFDSFRAEVIRFVDETSDELTREWDAALEAVSAAAITSMTLRMPALPAGIKPYAIVEKIEHQELTAALNKVDSGPSLAIPDAA